jgi:hypothetical protein
LCLATARRLARHTNARHCRGDDAYPLELLRRRAALASRAWPDGDPAVASRDSHPGDQASACANVPSSGRPDILGCLQPGLTVFSWPTGEGTGRDLVAMLAGVVSHPLTTGMRGHRTGFRSRRLRPLHPWRVAWPPTSIAAGTAAVSSSGWPWARPRRLRRARRVVGTPSGSSLYR